MVRLSSPAVSAEGLKDALARQGSGLLAISELGHYLDRNRWQYAWWTS